MERGRAGKGEQEGIEEGEERERERGVSKAARKNGEPLTIVAPREELTIVSRLIPALATTNVARSCNGQSKRIVLCCGERKNAELRGGMDGWMDRDG